MSRPEPTDSENVYSRFGGFGRAGARGSSLSLAGLLPTFLLHGAGGAFDEAIIFGGIGLMLGGLLFLMWRSGRKKKDRREHRRRGRRR